MKDLKESKSIQTVSVVGTGNVAWHLSKALHEAGIRIVSIISRSGIRAKEMAELTGASALTDLADNTSLPDLLLLCVSDDAIPHVASQYRYYKGLIAHTSAATGLDVFTQSQGPSGVFYPLQTFSIIKEMDYKSIPFFIEASSEESATLLAGLAEKISGRWHYLGSESRLMLHVSAVFASNFSNHMATIAQSILKDAGLEFDLLRPLLEQTTEKIKELSPTDAQTGPAIREDMKILETHLKALANKPDEQKIYKLLTNSIIKYKHKHE